jgi:predicted 3-demethylubiquinone-9 3-methyltransferase (glyoxalase superfamily)
LNRITPNLWFDGNAEEAATFYVELFPDSRIENVVRSPADNPSTAKGTVVVVEFILDGRPFAGINGGPQFAFTPAVSFDIDCADQAEVDRYWNLLTADGGKAGRCGWCTDRFGLSWQVIPRRLREMMMSPDSDAAERAMKAMLKMSKIEIDELEKAFNQ